mgnify:CR=1 FL=1
MSDTRKFVIFDLDGTLIDSYECVLCCVNKTLDFFNLAMIKSIPQSEKHRDIEEIFDKTREIIENHITYDSFKSVFDYVHYNNDFETIHINKQVYEYLLKYISTDYKIVILTNKFQKTAHRIIQKLFPNIDIEVIGRTSVHSLKSDVKLVKSRLSNLNLRLDECVCYYGDSIDDENLSHELGVTYIKTL